MNYQLPEPLKKYGEKVLTWALILFISVVVVRFGLEDSVTVVVPDFPQPPVEALFPSPVAVPVPDPTPDTAVTYGYQTLVHGDGPDKLVVESGGEVEVKSGGILDAQTGSVVGLDDVTVAGDMTVAGTATFNITSPTLTQNLNLTGTLTAEDIVVTDTLDVNGDIDLDGDGFDVNITAGFSVDGDAASNINVAGAGIDLTLEAEAGRLVLKADEALADGVYIDANDAAGTGASIVVGASGGLSIDGGLTDIGGGTYGTADGDNDLGVAGDLEVVTALTAEDGVISDTLDVNGDIDLDGDGFDVNITAGFSIDADAASNVNVAGAGIDLTLEAEAGRVVIKGDEAAANAVTITANDAAGTGVTIDVGSTGGVLISGGPTDIGGGTCGTATGDNDLCVADGFEVDGAADLDGTLIVDGATTLNHVSIDDWLTLDPATALSVTAGMVITPASSLQPLTSGSSVTCDTTICILTAGFTTGDILILRNDNAADTITIDGTGGTVECKADVVLGAADTLTLLFDGTDWNCLASYDNS